MATTNDDRILQDIKDLREQWVEAIKEAKKEFKRGNTGIASRWLNIADALKNEEKKLC